MVRGGALGDGEHPRRGWLGWSVVVPVKRREVAKSRLGGWAGAHRADLALAFALDTVSAALTTEDVRRVVVVTDDPEAAAELRGAGAVVVPDAPDAGLGPALRHGAALARRIAAGEGVAALQADLPALRPDALGRALRRAGRHETAFVPDAAGTGTTLYASRPDAAFEPGFGTDSARRHRDAGAVAVTGRGLETLRRDVDTEADLAAAALLGLGFRTRALLRALDRPA